jgi:Domain of unknown function (DUF6532)
MKPRSDRCLGNSLIPNMYMQGKEVGTKPYQHPAIVRIMSDRWFKPRSSLAPMRERYYTNNDSHPPQLPPSMPSFAATVVSGMIDPNAVPDPPTRRFIQFWRISNVRLGTTRPHFEPTHLNQFTVSIWGYLSI